MNWLRDREWVALDLEATGVAWGHDRIVEIGAVRFHFESDHIVPGPRFEALVNPAIPIPEVVSRITGLTDDSVRDAPNLETIWPEFVTFIEGAEVISHGARADLAWLGSEALRLGVCPPKANFHCTLELSRRAVPKARRHTLEALMDHLELKRPGAAFHRALADALHTRNLFGRCVTLLEAETLHDLGFESPLQWPSPEVYAVRIPPRLASLEPLVTSQQVCQIIYRGGSAGRDPRPITPLGFFAHEGVAYLRAWCHLSDAAKSFRCDRITSVQH